MAKLLEELVIRGKVVRNRIVLPPMATGLADEEGRVTEALIRHYKLRARGTGTVIVEHSFISKDGRFSTNQLGIHSDNMIPGLKKLAKAIKEEGAVGIIQLNHAGGKSPREVIGRRPLGPSPVRVPGGEEIPQELSLEEIDELVENFVSASKRAMQAGFDGVEIHGAHGFLLSQFLSPLTNVRSDEFGGTLENRMRLHLKIVEKVRKEIDGLLFFRLGVTDYMEGGLSIEEGVEVAAHLERFGVDVIDVSGGLCGSRPPWARGEGYFLNLSQEVKRRVKVPVIGVGGIKSPSFANEAILEGKADLMAVGRAFLADPEWALKAINLLKEKGADP